MKKTAIKALGLVAILSVGIVIGASVTKLTTTSVTNLTSVYTYETDSSGEVISIDFDTVNGTYQWSK